MTATHVLVWRDRHIDPVAYAGSEGECYVAACRLMIDYLGSKAEMQSLAIEIVQRASFDPKATVRWIHEEQDGVLYCYSLNFDIVPLLVAADAYEAPYH